ncbi:SMP-30/gluconolactonase/LRE family protein [Pelagicoccus sp. SDUM812003]|uniref:SMP-30/gluconolactonase/LRE family protein n=1 Tax=Pelagicoccus sp. SDUM812003 TaxID=3041267 RepID=UPI00280C51B0|nr:SMP-30/gluconolactonase/LRE family protein [Pelagicoccus sp. SDUM812003]MDQ8204776.1 SMP-30/gluconolactonase/LRE family protein [Pelagicoccus sp. SDUM812003]
MLEKRSRSLLMAACLLAWPSLLTSQEDQPRARQQPYQTIGEVIRLDPRLDQLLAEDARLEIITSGFDWSEGPVWDASQDRLLFSDIPRNAVYAWNETEDLSVFLQPSGFTGEQFDGREPGSNGLAIDSEGHLLLCQHGDRRVARLAADQSSFVTLADAYRGDRLNSPNDLCSDSHGNLFFTDPPYGLPYNTAQELPFQGVYRLTPSGQLTLLTKELYRPNGIALSPDEKTLYVASSHHEQPFIMEYPLLDDDSLGSGRIFFDSSPLRQNGMRGSNDGLKTDVHGNVWATTAGGLAVLSPKGELLGHLLTTRLTANCAFGGEDGKTLFLTADDLILRIETKVRGYSPKRTD